MRQLPTDFLAEGVEVRAQRVQVGPQRLPLAREADELLALLRRGRRRGLGLWLSPQPSMPAGDAATCSLVAEPRVSW